MTELTVFAMAYIGALTGVLTAVLPAIWLIKKKWENSPMGAMFG